MTGARTPFIHMKVPWQRESKKQGISPAPIENKIAKVLSLRMKMVQMMDQTVVMLTGTVLIAGVQ